MLLRWLVGHAVSKLVIRSHLRRSENGINWDEVRKDKTVNVDHFHIEKGSTSVDCCEISKVDPKAEIPISEQKVIIHAVGRSDCYEKHVDEYKSLAKKLPSYKIVAFNFRGTKNSKGRACSENDWVEDVLMVINRYRQQGVPVENILLNGHSMGAAFLTLAASRMYEQDCEIARKRGIRVDQVKSVKLMSDRSLSDLTETLLYSILGKKTNTLIVGLLYGVFAGLLFGAGAFSFGAAALSALGIAAVSHFHKETPQILLRPFLKTLLWATFGTINAAAAYQSLPQDSVEHLFVKKDKMVKNKSSLHYAIEPTYRARIQALQNQLSAYEDKSTGARNMRTQINNLKDCKLKFDSEYKNDESMKKYFRRGSPSHDAPLLYLRTYCNAKNPVNRQLNRVNRAVNGQTVQMNKIKKLMA